MKEEELLVILKAWKKMLTNTVGWIDRDNRAHKEIVAILKNQPTITEEWIEEKALKMKRITANLFRKTGTMNYPLGRCRDFIRSLVEEIPLQQLDKNGK